MDKRQIAFDIDTNELKKYYPTESWRYAYEQIKTFMIRNGFVWRQGSVYESRSGISDAKTTRIIKKLAKEYPYLNKCMRDCVVTIVGRSHNQTSLFNKNLDYPTREERNNSKKPKLKDQIRKAKDTFVPAKNESTQKNILKR